MNILNVWRSLPILLIVIGNVTAGAPPPYKGTLVLAGARIYRSPTTPPIPNGTVLIRSGKIQAVNQSASITAPPGTKVLDCTGLVVVAGFQNSHVHFTESKWDHAEKQPASKLSQQLTDIFTRYGDTTVVDLGSFLENTTAIRRRIEAGDVTGPRILTAGSGLFPPDGTPFYVRDTLPPETLKLLPQPQTPAQAISIVDREIQQGTDVLKLFTGSLVSRDKIKLMPRDIAAAAVADAHRHHQVAFAHPSNVEGLEVALKSGVDVAAHTTPIAGPWSSALIEEMKQRHMSLIPTLKLWEYEAAKDGASAAQQVKFAMAGAEELGQYSRAGGQILFGTDVGYMQDYNPTEEYALMNRAGLTPMQILASLTTAPAERFHEAGFRGTIAPGMDADLVVLKADPAQDSRNFARVRYTIRRGKVIYSSKEK